MRVPIIDVKGRNAAMLDDIGEAVARVVAHGEYILGRSVLAFEAEVASRLAVKAVLGVNSGTDAIFLVLKGLEIGPGDEVITTPNTFVATAAAVRHTGSAVRLVDVDEDENLSADAFAEAINSRTRAVIAVHLRGRPARMDEICRIAEARDIVVIEDASQAFGAMLHRVPTGRLGHAACFSLHPQKILGACGDAGMITTNDEALASRINLLRNHGLRTRDAVEVWGFNSRLDPIQAEILRAKLARIDDTVANHRRAAETYRFLLADLPITLPSEQPQEFSVYYQYSIMTDDRDALLDYLHTQGIDARVHYPTLIHRQPAGTDVLLGPRGLPQAERQAARQLSLPIFDGITENQLSLVADTVRGYFERTTASASAVKGESAT